LKFEGSYLSSFRQQKDNPYSLTDQQGIIGKGQHNIQSHVVPNVVSPGDTAIGGLCRSSNHGYQGSLPIVNRATTSAEDTDMILIVCIL